MSRRLRPCTRRAFLGGTAAVVAATGTAAVAGLAGDSPGPAARLRPTPAPGLRPAGIAENSLPGDRDWWIRDQGAPDEIAGYAGQASVLPGQPVDLYVSTTAREFTVRAFRVGWYNGDLARQVWASGPVRGHRQRAPALMPAAAVRPVPASPAPAGTAHAGPALAGRAGASPAPAAAVPTNTVRADWGQSVTVPTGGWPDGSYLLRLDAASGAQRFVPLTVRSASTAGRVVLKNAVSTWQAYNTWGGYDLYLGPGASYADRALTVSLDRPYDQQGAFLFLVYERKLINLAERMGLPLAYLTSIDIATDPHALDGASALVSPGHDEYWTPQERACVTAARNAGTNLAFLGANAMFRRIRLAPTGLGASRLVICYKTSYLEDPLYGVDNALVTNDFREPPDPDPESSLTGTLYEGFPAVADFVVAAADAWTFAGTGVAAGDRFPALVGIEYDRVNPGSPVERPIQVLSHSPLTCNGVNSYGDSAYYTHPGGAGVFNAGTMRWVESFGPPTYNWGLTRACGRLTRRVTANVLRAFADGPAAARYPARDNLAEMREWPGDPIAAGHDLWT
jgi:hypothetical protein